MRLEYDEILDKCTFQPKINQNSKILAEKSQNQELLYIKRCDNECERAYQQPKECTQRGILFKYGEELDPKDIKNENFQISQKPKKRSKKPFNFDNNDKNAKKRIETHCQEFWGVNPTSKKPRKIENKIIKKCEKIKEKIIEEEEFNLKELLELQALANHKHTEKEIFDYSKKLHKASEKLEFKDFIEHVDTVYQRKKDRRKPLREKRVIERKRPECKNIHLVEFDEERQPNIKLKMIEKSKNPNLIKFV